MHESNNHRDFHFKGVLKVKSIFGDTPLSMEESHLFSPNDFHAEKLIVNDSAVYTHSSHQIKDITKFKINNKSKQHKSMSPVTKHHSKQYRDRCKHKHLRHNLIKLGN
jgi:hypothetical protein